MIIDLETGSLTLEQLQAIMRTINVEFDFIDKDNVTRWYSNNRRFFSRELSDLNKDVFDVHPGKSADRIQSLLDAFASGEKDHFRLVVPSKGSVLQIEFHALYNPEGEYLGVIELSQDVGHLVGEESKIKTMMRNIFKKK